MAVQQVVINVSGGANTTINVLPLPSPSELGPHVSEDEERATAAAFLGTLSASARDDARRNRISEAEARTLNLTPDTSGAEQDAGLRVGESFRQWGDAVQSVASAIAEDDEVNEFIDAAAGGHWSTAFEKFKMVARHVLQCDEDVDGQGAGERDKVHLMNHGITHG